MSTKTNLLFREKITELEAARSASGRLLNEGLPKELPDTPSTRARLSGALLSLACIGLVLLSSTFVCFYNLDRGRVTVPDELNEIQAAIEMMQGEKWWLPTYNGKPYLHKPPLKMWLTWPVLRNFSETNFAFRFVDACSGLVVSLLIYFAGLNFFRSRFAGVVSVFAFLGCDIIIRYHGVRTANQDAALLMFSTIALLAVWPILDRAAKQLKPKGSTYLFALIAGLALAAAVLTKSAAGLISLIVVFSYCLLSGLLLRLARFSWKPTAIALLIAAAGIAAYFVPVCLSQEGAYGQFFNEHILARIRTGHGNINPPLFYLERLVVERAAVPPELVIIALFVALFTWLRRGSRQYAYLFFWCVMPVLCFSFSKTKLSWYIAASLPAMALLAGGLLSGLLRSAKNSGASNWQRGAASVLLLLGIASLGYNFSETITSVTRWQERMPFDVFVEELRGWEKKNKHDLRVANYHSLRLARREKPYFMLLESTRIEREDKAQLIKRVNAGELDLIFTRPEVARELVAELPIHSFKRLVPEATRRRHLVVFSMLADKPLPGFQNLQKHLDFGSGSVRVIEGFLSTDKIGEESIRWTIGPRASFYLPGHEYFEERGATLSFDIAAHAPEDSLLIDLFVNGRAIRGIELLGHAGDRFEVSLAPGVIHAGDNVVRFQLAKKSGAEVGDVESAMLVNWVDLRLP